MTERIVVKLGTSLLTDESGRLNEDFLRTMVAQCAEVRRAGHELVIVSSGAVGAGRGELKIPREKKGIPYRQALAAVGQEILMATYRGFFSAYGIRVAQALLTNYDFVNRENFLNVKHVFELLLKNGVVPIVNENDVTTIAELKFGDNDMLSAKTAGLVGASLLVIFTDVDGLFSEDPKKNKNAHMLRVVPKIDESVKALAGGARSNRSLGGMVTKLEAAEYVMSLGIPMAIAGGRRPGVLAQVMDFFLGFAGVAKGPFFGAIGFDAATGIQRGRDEVNLPFTFFPTSVSRIESQKKWLKPKIQKAAWVEVDDGAAKALQSGGKSLLPSGVSKVFGDFRRGDVVYVKSAGNEIAYGQVNYGSEEIEKIKKRRSGEIEKILSYSFEEELIHRDRMVVLR